MGNTDNKNSIARQEHNPTYGSKKGLLYGLTTGSVAVPIQVDAAGIVQTAGGGGGIVDSTVGPTLGTYADVQAAIDDGQNRVRILEDTTEDSNVVTPTGAMYIWIDNDVTWNISSITITMPNVAGDNLIIEGFGEITGIPGNNDNFTFGTNNVVDIRNITITNTSTVGGRYSIIAGGCNLTMDNVEFKYQNDGGSLKTSTPTTRLTNITVNGTAASARECIFFDGGSIYNMKVTGTFAAGGQFLNVQDFGTLIDGITETDRVNTGGSIVASVQGSISNVKTTQLFKLSVAASLTTLNNIDMPIINGNEIDLNNSQFLNISNVKTYHIRDGASVNMVNADCFSITQIGGLGGRYTNIRLQTSLTVNGNDNLLTSIFLDNGNIDFNVTGERNSLINCKTGDSSGETGTVNINTGNDHRVIGCWVDVAVFDGGTDTVLSGNIIR